MTHLLCRLGIHSPRWVAVTRDRWLQVRTCARCGLPLTHHLGRR